MRSKNSKRKPAARRAGKLAVFLRRAGIFISVSVFIAALVMGVYVVAQAFYIRDIQVSGNDHLNREDIADIIKIRRGESLFNLSLSEIDECLKSNAWVKKTYLRWQLPGTLVINIEEASPKALLSYGGAMFLVNGEGNVMERTEDAVTPFLPVIKEIDPRYKRDMSEAMKLIAALAEKNILADKQQLEIGLDTYGLNVNIDGELIKVGYGEYSEKFDRWIALEPELRKMSVPVLYVDLRFKDSVIVKPVKPEKEKDKDKAKTKTAEKPKEQKKEKKI